MQLGCESQGEGTDLRWGDLLGRGHLDGNEGDGKIDFMIDRKQILSMGTRWKLAQHRV
jgi:hypothetical protein